MSAFSRKCMFLKKPLETLTMAQTQRSLFVESTLKCPVMSQVLREPTAAGKCPFSEDSLLNTLNKTVRRAIHTAVQDLHQKTAPHNQKPKSMVTQREEIVTPTHGGSSKGGYNYERFFDNMIKKKVEDHSYRVFRKVNRNAATFPMAEDFTFSERPRPITVWCSNDYLGMSRHPEVVNAAKSVIDTNGVGAGGTRNISGTSAYHSMLENEVASWHEKEAGLLFTSCYVANDTALFTLGKQMPGCLIFSDAGNHASMIHGVRTSGAKKSVFRHNDPGHLEELLRNADPHVPKIVAFETVHSMSGAVCPLEQLCDVAHKYGAITFVDEVHAVGLYGKHGAGIGERDGCLDKMDIISGTLGKAVGCIGGYLAGDSKVIDTIRSYGSGFIFTTALPPDKVYAAVRSIEILRSPEGEKLRQRHQSNVRDLRNKLVRNGFPVEPAPSHIIPIMACDPDKCTRVSEMLQARYGMYIQSINYPTVPRGQEKLRVAPTPFHTPQMADDLVDALTGAWREVGLPFLYPVCEISCECQDCCVQNGSLAV